MAAPLQAQQRLIQSVRDYVLCVSQGIGEFNGGAGHRAAQGGPGAQAPR